jgi:hypothetical protein
VVLPTAVLGPLAERWRRPGGEVAVPPLRSGLAAVTQSGWASTAVPMAPSRVTRHYADVVEAGGVVAADPGIAGYWVARTLATTRPASVHVPAATGVGGFAVAVAVVSRLRRPWRPALAVVDGPASDAVAEVVDAGRRLGVAVGVEAWDPEGPPLGPDDHLARLASLVTAPGPVAALATDPRPLRAMLDVAGPVVVWGGLPGA